LSSIKAFSWLITNPFSLQHVKTYATTLTKLIEIQATALIKDSYYEQIGLALAWESIKYATVELQMLMVAIT